MFSDKTINPTVLEYTNYYVCPKNNFCWFTLHLVDFPVVLGIMISHEKN